MPTWKHLLVLFVSVSLSLFSFAMAQEAEKAGKNAIERGVDLESAAETLEQTVVSIWHDFVAHLPYIAAALVVIIFTSIISVVIKRVVHRLTGHLRQSLRELIERLVTILVWTIGLLLAAMVIFPGLTPAKAIGALGLMSVAIGFAFKEIFENFFAGILLLWKYPFEKGDFIECEGIVGKVEDISVRMTQIRKSTGELVVTPNAFLFKNPVEVLTDQTSRRITIMTGVAYDENATEAIPIIEKAVKSCESVHNDKPIQVFLNAFGSSSIDIEVTWWAAPTPLGHRKSRSEVIGAVKAALDDAGIEIPFPYRTMTFKEPLSIRQQSED